MVDMKLPNPVGNGFWNLKINSGCYVIEYLFCKQGNMTTHAKDLINILSYNDVSTLFGLHFMIGYFHFILVT